MERRSVAIACVVGIALAVVLAVALWPSEPETPPVRLERYAQIPRIDVHVHVPPARAAEAMRVFARYGVRVALNASGGHPGRGLDASIAAMRATSGRLIPYCSLDFSRVDRPDFLGYARATLDRCRADGAIGLKIYKALGLGVERADGTLLRVDDPILDPVFTYAGELGLPILIHTGDPQAFFRPADDANERLDELRAHPSWSFYGRRANGEQWPSWDEVFEQFERRVARHPDTTFVGAHFGNAPEDPSRVAAMLERNPRYVVETGARIPEIGRHDPRRMRAFFTRFADRVLFGTDIQLGPDGEWVLGSAGSNPDPPARIPHFFAAHFRFFETHDRNFPHPTPIQGRWSIDGIALPRDVLEKIYHRNAARVFGLTLDGRRP